ncbi:MAG: alkylhydroperoxidase-related (seleno)protein, partial [Acidimicrobiales bacterium]
KMLEPFPFANVARALSQVPSANTTFYTLVRPMYSAAGFDELVWTTPLSRPQVELVAARVAAMNECFY